MFGTTNQYRLHIGDWLTSILLSVFQSSAPFVAVKNPSTQGLNIKRLVFPSLRGSGFGRVRTWSSNQILWRRSRLRFKGGPPGGWWAQRGHWAQKQVTKSVPQSEWLADSEAEQKHLISIWQIQQIQPSELRFDWTIGKAYFFSTLKSVETCCFSDWIKALESKYGRDRGTSWPLSLPVIGSIRSDSITATAYQTSNVRWRILSGFEFECSLHCEGGLECLGQCDEGLHGPLWHCGHFKGDSNVDVAFDFFQLEGAKKDFSSDPISLQTTSGYAYAQREQT